MVTVSVPYGGLGVMREQASRRSASGLRVREGFAKVAEQCFSFKLRLQEFLFWTKMVEQTAFSSEMKPPVIKSSSARKLSPAAAKLRLLKKLRCTLRYERKAWASGAQLVAARIDQINIYHASRAAMREAVMRLTPAADHLLIDALRIDCDQPQISIIHGDALSASIAAASILAKVERDRIMCEWDAVFPTYGLASHKGYSTPKHLAALRKLGPTPLHRQSFAPVWQNPVPQEVFGFMDDDNIDLEVTAAG